MREGETDRQANRQHLWTKTLKKKGGGGSGSGEARGQRDEHRLISGVERLPASHTGTTHSESIGLAVRSLAGEPKDPDYLQVTLEQHTVSLLALL